MRIAIASLILGLLPCAAHASEEDTQFWLSADASTRAAADLAASVTLERRFRAAGDQMRLSGKADWAAADWLILGTGALMTDNPGPNEYRPHQHVTFVLGRLQLRSQLDLRFFDDAPRPQLRLRQRVQWKQPLSDRNGFTVSGELYYIARPQLNNQSAGVDQWRVIAMYNHRLSSTVEASAGYLFNYAPRDDGPDRIIHAPQLALSYRF